MLIVVYVVTLYGAVERVYKDIGGNVELYLGE